MLSVTVFMNRNEEFKVIENNGKYTYIDELNNFERESSIEEIQRLVDSKRYEVQELTF
jgi:hypothetical protein